MSAGHKTWAVNAARVCAVHYTKAIKKLNGFLKDDNAYAEYNVHEKFGDIMIKIVDKDTKEVLVEVPPKKILDMIAKLCEISGVVFDKKA